MFKKYIFIVFSLLLITFVYLVFNFEFRTPILSGFILAVLTFPVFRFFKNQISRFKPNFIKKLSPTIGAILTVVICGYILYLISNFVLIQVISEINVNSNNIIEWASKILNSPMVTDNAIKLGLNPNDIRSINSELLQNIEPFLTSFLNFENISRFYNVGAQLFNIIFSQILYLIIFLIAWYNALIYGPNWIKNLIGLLPIEEDQKKLIKHELKLGIRNVIYANLLSGALNATLVIILMVSFNLPGAFIFGLFTFFVGFLPLTPSEIGYLPLILMLLGSNPILAIVVAIFCEIFILYLNYGLLPKVVLTGTEGNPLFIITSVLTGIAFFGIMGFIIGPTIMIFINTFSHITYRNIMQSREKKV
jgi:predicted PurR-regulated permease PerM